MTTRPLDQQTYLPDPENEIAEVLSFLEAHRTVHGAAPEPRYFLAGPEEHDQVELPAAVHRALIQVLKAMKAGKAVTVAPQNTLLTTQQTADLLGVSRPTVIRMIDKGDLPADTPGTTRRMIKLDDVLAFRERRREAQLQAIFDTSEDYDLSQDAAQVLADLRRARAEVAARRRARSAND